MERGFRSQGGGFGGPMPPVKVGDELEVTILSVGAKGDGLAKKDGFVLFVPGVKEGQNVRIRVTKVLRKVGFAEIAGGAASEGASESAPSESAEPAESAEDSEEFGEEQ